MTQSTISAQTALVYLMVIVSASDRDMTDSELKRMGEIIATLPIFNGYNPDKLVSDAETCAEILDNEDGLDAVLGLVQEALPQSHVDIAYTVACDIAVVDAHLSQEELRMLEIIRHKMNIDRLTAAAIERASAARRRRL